MGAHQYHRAFTTRCCYSLCSCQPLQAGRFPTLSLQNTGLWQTWTKITGGLAENDFTRVIREDPVRRGLLYAGTETGVHVSFDHGARWETLQLNLPRASVRDLTIHGADL